MRTIVDINHTLLMSMDVGRSSSAGMHSFDWCLINSPELLLISPGTILVGMPLLDHRRVLYVLVAAMNFGVFEQYECVAKY